MKTLVTGLQPSGQLTLGNYIGALKNITNLQKEYKTFIFIANLHSITMPQEKKKLKIHTKELAKMLMACGADGKNTNLFIQSNILEHAQLGHILLCNTSMDELKKMTQFKDKSSKGVKMPNGTTMIPTGLFTYPSLMAADILLYQGDVVPVGEDQQQHLELTMRIANRMNSRFGKMFKIPQILIPKECARIMSLTEPTKKMSKSDSNPKSYILLLDDLKVVRKKIMSAITDSENIVKYDKQKKPGVSNLIKIFAAVEDISIVEAENKLKNKNYKKFKETIADSVCALLEKIQNNYIQINDEKLNEFLKKGTIEAKKIAYRTLQEVQNKTGINYVEQ